MTACIADDTLSISSGTIDITRSYEGLEGAKVLISGGKRSPSSPAMTASMPRAAA